MSGDASIPFTSETAPTLPVDARAVSPVLAHVLGQVIESNYGRECSSELLRFRAQDEPGVTVAAYLDRIARYGLVSGEAFVLALIYIDRVIMAQPGCIVTPLNVHRLLITASTLAAKYFDDAYCSNRHLAAVGGISNAELNALEVDFLFLCGGGFSLYVSLEEYRRYYHELQIVGAGAVVPGEAPRLKAPAPPAAVPVPCPAQQGAGPRRRPEGTPVWEVVQPPKGPDSMMDVDSAAASPAASSVVAVSSASSSLSSSSAHARPHHLARQRSGEELRRLAAGTELFRDSSPGPCQQQAAYTRKKHRAWPAGGMPGCFAPHVGAWTRQLDGSPA